MKKIGILILYGLLLLPCSAMAMTAEIGKVTATEGRVDVTRAPDNEAVMLVEGASVFVGDSIRAKDHSKAEIAFSDKSVVKIAPNTRMEIKDFAVKGSARQSAQIHLARGKIFADVSKTGRADTFVITTPNARGSVRGTEVIVFYAADRTSALVKDGRLSISNISLPDQMKDISGGETTMIPFALPPEKPRPYMDAEFALHEQDTKPAIFRAVSLGKDAKVMRGAITTLTGGVRVLKKGAVDWHYAKLNEFVEEGDKVETAEDGMVSFLFDNGNSIQLQPNSRIMLSILKRDPKTGEFDNTFEMEGGKVKAVVDKLGKGSNFRVKTPTALCGVRGTVMYVNVAAGATQAFYEGGGGVVTNPVSGDTQFVESGQNAISTGTGAISAPMATSTEVAMTLDSSYSYGVAADGYSSPENTTTASTQDGGAAILDVTSISDTKTSMGSGDVMIPADLVPITEANKPQPQPGVSTIEDVGFSAKVGLVNSSANFSPESPANSVTGNFTLSVSVDSIWTSVGQGQIIGNVSSNTGIPVPYAFWTSEEVKCVSPSGGQYRGWLGASLSVPIALSPATTLWGKALCLYRDPHGWAGTMTFDAGGYYDSPNKYFYSALNRSGDVVFTPREFVGPGFDLNALPLTVGSMYGRGSGGFSGGGPISCGATGINTGLSGRTFDIYSNWGIFQFQAQGVYSGLTSDNWALALGGERDGGPGNSTYWIGTVAGDIWDDRTPNTKTNQATGAFSGIVFWDAGSDIFHGGSILNGGIVGFADPVAGTWQAIGGGEFYISYQNFTAAQLGFNADAMKNFVNVPVNLVGGAGDLVRTAGSAQFTNFKMDTQVYRSGSLYMWTGSITGGFREIDQPLPLWTVTLAQGADTIKLINGTWDDTTKTWSAVIDGTVPISERTLGGRTIVGGQAGGTMTLNGDNSTIEGIAAGTAI